MSNTNTLRSTGRTADEARGGRGQEHGRNGNVPLRAHVADRDAGRDRAVDRVVAALHPRKLLQSWNNAYADVSHRALHSTIPDGDQFHLLLLGSARERSGAANGA